MQPTNRLVAYLATVTLAAAIAFAAIGVDDLARVLVGAAAGIVGGAASQRRGGE